MLFFFHEKLIAILLLKNDYIAVLTSIMPTNTKLYTFGVVTNTILDVFFGNSL